VAVVTVRFRLVLTVLATGILSAIAIIATLLTTFNYFEQEVALRRDNVFLDRVVQNYDNLLEMRDHDPQRFGAMLENLVLYQPQTQLILLDRNGRVLNFSGSQPEYASIPIPTIRQLVDRDIFRAPDLFDALFHKEMANMAARCLYRRSIKGDGREDGYLYLVDHTDPKAYAAVTLGPAFGTVLATPALTLIGVILLVSTLVAMWIVAFVTRPLRELTDVAEQVTHKGLDGFLTVDQVLSQRFESGHMQHGRNEFGAVFHAIGTMLKALSLQWSSLQQLDRFRREGVSNMSHDLRSPLTATEACLETLSARLLAEPEREADLRLVDIALRNARDATRLVRSLGDLATLDEPAFLLHLESLDADDFLDSIVVRFANAAQSHGMQIDMESLDRFRPEDRLQKIISVDVGLFERAISNLIENALKFGKRGGHITLGSKAQDGGILVTVADDGVGIEPVDLPRLFNRFYQSRTNVNPSSSAKGHGLGLAIVKRIVELHGGEISVASEPDVGTTITLTLPAVRSVETRTYVG
jgi:signal transduction histidine kinase